MITAARALCLSLLLSLGACGSDPPPDVFTLVPLPVAQASPAPGLIVAVQDVDIPRYLDRPQIVRYGSTYQLEVSDVARWGEPFGAMVTRVLVADLSRNLPGAQVFQETDATAVPAQRSLEVTVNAFEADPENVILLSARWVVRQANTRDLIFSDAAEIRVPNQNPTLSGMANAMSQALGQLSQEIALSLRL
ncbi:MAG: PqiC family protein [Pseudomonadota bacterium]